MLSIDIQKLTASTPVLSAFGFLCLQEENTNLFKFERLRVLTCRIGRVVTVAWWLQIVISLHLQSLISERGGSRILSLDSNKSPSLDQWLKDELRFLHGRNHALLGAAGFFKQVGQVIRHSLLWQKMEGILSKWVGIRPARCQLKCLTSCFQ